MKRAGAGMLLQGSRLFSFLFASLIFCALSTTAAADDYPPYWNDGNPATESLHYPIHLWPASDADWGGGYTHSGNTINDLRTADPSNGGRAPQNYANVSSQCSDGAVESVYWFFEDDGDRSAVFFRWRVEQIPNTYATGPGPGTYSSVDPWKSAQWTVLIDIDGDGYREFAVQVDGASGLPATPIDMLQSIYSNTESQALDFDDDPDVHLLFHQPTAFIDFGTDQILNFRSALNPSPDWPNGSAETVWDYGSTRVTDISVPTCEEYLVDYQIPLAMLDATSVGGPKLDEFSPFCMAFVTANSNENPLQKDIAFNGSFTADVDGCVPCGDLITLAGDVIPQPVVDKIGASGCGPATLTARVRDAINIDCTDTLTSVDFYYCYDADASGICDTSGSEGWVAAGGTPAVDADDPSAWSLVWDSSSELKGQYLVGVRAEDDQGNVTFSFLTQAEVDAATFPATGAANEYGNSDPSPGVLTDSFVNSCGNFYEVVKTADFDYVSRGEPVQFTVTIDNQTTSDLTVTGITDTRPPGFSYVSTDSATGPLNPPPVPTVSEVTGDGVGNDDGTCEVQEIIGDGVGNDDGTCDALEECYQESCTVTWDYGAGVTIGAASSAQILFTADTDYVAEGTYSNTASVNTDAGVLVSEPLDIGVGAPRLTILKTASDNSVLPGDPVTYTITYANNSPVNAPNVTITDPLPVGTGFVAATGGGVYDSATRTVTWDVGDLASLEGPYTVSFEVIVDKEANARTVNTATIDSDETAPTDGTATIFVRSPLQIEKTADKSLVDPGGTSPDNEVVFSIAYENTGATTLTSVTIVDTTPPGFTYLSNTGGGSAAEPGDDGYGNDNGICDAGEPCTVTWTIGTLTSGSGGTVSVTLRVVDPYTERDNPALNTAVISCDQINDINDTAGIGIIEGDCQGTPDTYYFRNLFATTLPFPEEGGSPLPSTPERYYANQTPPTNPTAAAIGPLAMPNGVEVEFGHFYQDPALDRPTDFSLTGNVDIWVYIDKPGGTPVGVTAYLYDYDPGTGVAIQIGQQQQVSCNGRCANEEITFSIVPTGIVNEGSLMLWRFTGTGGNNSGDTSLSFDGTGSQGRSDVCFAPLSVTIDKSVDLVVANPTNTLTYTIEFSNSGLRDLTGARIADTVPSGSTLQTSTLNGTLLTEGVDFTCVGNPDGSETCTYDVSTTTGASGVLVGGESGTLVLTTLIDTEANLLSAGIESLTNTAVISSDDTEDSEDSATTDINLTATPAIVLMKTADVTRLLPGGTVTYTVLVLNAGDAAASNVTVMDVIPAETWFTYIAGSISGGDSRNDSAAPNLTWTINSLAGGERAALTFQMLVAATGVPGGVTEKDNKATATEATTTPPDSNTVTVSITTNAILSIEKSVSSPAAVTDPVGTGDGSTTVFNATLSSTPIQSGSVRLLVEGVEVGVDSGTGVIVGASLTSSTIDYTTGDLHLQFLTAPANGAVITAIARAELSPGETAEYTMTVSNIGASDATSVVVSDPIPDYATYSGDTLHISGSSRTDANDGDNASFDPVNNRTLFSLGTLAVDDSETASFSAVIDSIMPNGATSVTNRATVSSADTASKSASTVSEVRAAPDLSISKRGPSTVPYPLTTLDGNHNNTATLNVFNTLYFNVGDKIYIDGQVTTVLAVNSATQVTVDDPISANGSPVIPTIRYRITYTNNGSATATNLRVKDILQVSPDLSYITADPLPDHDPGFDTNGIVNWSIASLAAGESGSITLWAVPTAAGTYDNLAILSSDGLDDIDSNTVTTNAGGIEFTKQTSVYPPVPTLVNSGGTSVTYVITLTPQINVVVDTVDVIDSLPAGFTYNSTTSITGGACTITPSPGDASPTWGDCTITPAGSPLVITFIADIAATVGSGTYQNAVTATANQLDVLIFDELITDSDDVTITVPGDLKLNKTVQILSDPCEIDTCQANYAITVTNVGTDTVTAMTVNDLLPSPDTSYVGDDGGGTYNSSSGDWTVPVPLAPGEQATLNITATLHSLDVVTNCASLSGSTPADTNSANDTSCASIVPTPAALSGFTARRRGGSVVIQWETAMESGTVGFRLLRLDPSGDEYVPVSDRLLPGLINSVTGGTYRLRDWTAPEGEDVLTYLLVEVDGRGGSTEHGPFTVDVRATSETPATLKEEDYTRTVRPLPEKRKARLAQARQEGKAARLALRGRDGQAVKITTSREGLHYLSATEIGALLNVSEGAVRKRLGRAGLRLSNRGRTVAYLPAEENSGLFFFAEELKDNYTEQNVYWLDSGRGRHMREVKWGTPPGSNLSSSPETLHLEVDRDAMPNASSDPEADYWLWEYFIAGDTALGSRIFAFEAHGVSSESAAAELTVSLFGITNTAAHPDHHVTVSLNGVDLGEARWDGFAPYTLTLPFDQALLNEGKNTLELTALLDPGVAYSYVYLNDFDVNYRRLHRSVDDSILFSAERAGPLTVGGFSTSKIMVFDVTEPSRPILHPGAVVEELNGLSRAGFVSGDGGNRFLAVSPGGLLEPDEVIAGTRHALQALPEAEYIIVTTDALAATAALLADYRTGTGLSTLIITMEEIYDSFSYGIATPLAIRAFVRHATEEWSVKMKFLVLAGEGTFDYRDLGGHGDNLVPPLMVPTPWGLATSDNALADVDGDHVPDAAVGRLPVLTAEELATFISRIIAYESGSGEAWERRLLFAADDPNPGADFPADSEDVARSVTPDYSVERIYLSEMPIAEARRALQDTINSGVYLLSYIGHGGLDRIASEQLLTTADVANLLNGSMLPVVTAMTCYVGGYGFPGFDSLGEALVMRDDGGAIAFWGPSGLSLNDPAVDLAQGFYDAFFVDSERVLGEAVQQACREYGQGGSALFEIDIYNILGDPALRLR